ncbi:MAG: Histidinol-phosphate aminotransferase [Cytophagales bacterium]|jgi:histidinol-phosphate aminotransferase|nr:histidinol-phosphate transaminase [Bacteroidota bacterium]MBS1979585.1 histidinol-phosphate transaminase [Bacteroidota bacterium]WHZ09214.1 MAG: Histidinol-phosphate aminotransferase [Cytophagales bacterium]
MIPDISKLLRPHLKNLKPYSSARDEFAGEAQIFMDANENPFATGYNRYPDPHQKKLKQKIASIQHVSEDQLFIGHGSDEVIDLLLRAFCVPTIDEVIIAEPTYGMYQVSARINDIKVKPVKLTASFDLDKECILSPISAHTKLIFLCSPNNPTGNILNPDTIHTLLKNFNGLVLIDEAYIDFASSPSWVTELGRYKNLVVLQTLSKAWGLAGLRLGMCFADSTIISVLNKIKLPYNISEPQQQAALKALHDVKKKEREVKKILAQRQWLTEKMNDIKIINHIYPSEANFLLVKMTDARAVYQKLLAGGIVVRDRSKVVLCQNCLRITVGTTEENEALITLLKKL